MALTWPNIAFDRIAGLRSLAAVGQRERSGDASHRPNGPPPVASRIPVRRWTVRCVCQQT
ncbi:MAG: hypothetical protein NTAFB01_43510 [Nitrospira sp.]